MAGTWMSIVEGFGGMRVRIINYIFHQKFERMEGYSFKINFRNK
jgi:maltose phosphorylase